MVIIRLDEDRTSNSVASIRRLLRLYDGHKIELEAACITEDVVSTAILRLFHPVILQRHFPVSVAGDGNCLYRAVSMALYGSEDAHLYIRLMAAMEVIENSSSYDTTATDHVAHAPEYDRLLVVGSYESLVTDAVRPGSWSEMMHLYAVSAALNIVVESYMPPTTTSGDTHRLYSRKVIGRGVRSSVTPRLTLMWSSTTRPTDSTSFRVNHIVSLTTRTESRSDISTVSVKDVEESDDDVTGSTFVVDQENESPAQHSVSV